jgi:hypothetical protein
LSLNAYCLLLAALRIGSASLVALRVSWYETAVAEIEHAGGTTSSRRGAAVWRVERAFEVIRNVDLSGCSITDDGLKSVAGPIGMQTLVMRNTQIGDAGVARLARQKSLRRLDISVLLFASFCP